MAPLSRWNTQPIKNRPAGSTEYPATQIISPDALALVRFGLRSAHDPRIVNTVKAIDALLRVETPSVRPGIATTTTAMAKTPMARPFDGTGIGRLWPLLTGERAHYELAAGRRDEAIRLMHAMEAFAGDGCMIPEQIWDAPDIPDRELFFGRPSGSAMPLVWAHAEYVKLRRSLREGRIFDMPPQSEQRYLVDGMGSNYAAWRFNQKLREMPPGKTLRIEVLAPAVVHWSLDGWQTVHDTATRDTGLGMYVVDLPTGPLSQGGLVQFTFHWQDDDRWEGVDFTVRVKD